MRGISTVLDVAVFLLLVAAAVGTLTAVQPPADTDTSADETAEVLASSTLSVEYDIGGETRRAHGTAGTLLARAAVANATLDGEELSSADADFRETVRRETRARLAAPNRTQVLVEWVPYRGGPMGGRVTVGPDPPGGVDVHAATVTVPAPVPASKAVARNRSDGGYEPVARAVAAAVADGLLPATRVDASIYRESPAAVTTSSRYRTIAAETDVPVRDPLARGAVGEAHQRAVDGLADLFASDMRRRFDSPGAAAEAVRTGTVRITVRRWEP